MKQHISRSKDLLEQDTMTVGSDNKEEDSVHKSIPCSPNTNTKSILLLGKEAPKGITVLISV